MLRSESSIPIAKFRQASASVIVREALAGKLGANGSPAILIIVEVKFNSAKVNWRIHSAKLELSFSQHGEDEELQVDRIAPERGQFVSLTNPSYLYNNIQLTPHIQEILTIPFSVYGKRVMETTRNLAIWDMEEDDSNTTPRGITNSNAVAVVLRYDESKPDIRMGACTSLGVYRTRLSVKQTSKVKEKHSARFRPTNQDLQNLDDIDLRQYLEDHYPPLGPRNSYLFHKGARNEPALLPLSRFKFRFSFLRNFFAAEFSTSKAQVYFSLAARIIAQGLEGFGGAMLAFAALKPNIDSDAARWAISVPAFVGLIVPAVCKVFPYLDPSKSSAGDDVLKKLDNYYPQVVVIPGAELLAPETMAPMLLVESLGQTLLDVVGCLVGVLWNMAAGNGLVQNGYVGLISCVVASASIALSLLCGWQCFHRIDRKILSTEVVDDENPLPRSEVRKLIQKFQYLIAAPILLGIICALASVLGAAYTFGKSGDAESSNNRTSERNDYIVGQVFPAAVNFVFVARYLAELPHLLFRFGDQETDALLVYQRSRRERRVIQEYTPVRLKKRSGEPETSKV
jgi:hypothetical protein